jgi:prepilin-type N-terminal cleavage/methylation domain-containing protein
MQAKLIAQKGFTLIELMIVVAIVGILAMVAVPMFKNALDKAKRTEAVVQLGNIGDKAAERFTIDGAYPSVTAPLTPAVDCCTQNVDNKRKCAVVGTDWDTPEWSTFGFALTKEFQFQYQYTPSGTSKFTAQAIGNTNCDKTVVTYTNVGDTVGSNPRTKIIYPPNSD